MEECVLERFGKFQLFERIGEGGMAEVYLAQPLDASLSKLVAVKRILPNFQGDPAFEEMFRTEGKIAMQFRHSAIIAVHEMGVIHGCHYMSMEYFPGKPLATIINLLSTSPVKLSIPEKVAIIRSIAEALQYVHNFTDHGDRTEFIHRDISPHNIMVGFDGAAKLIDFGIAKDASNETTQSKYIKGKIAYMSPEQVNSESLNKQTDIFSLGIVLWELLAERKLFVGRTVQEISEKVREFRVPPLSRYQPDMSEMLNSICQKALSRDLSTRYSSAGAMVHDLNAYLRSGVEEVQQRYIAEIMRNLFHEDFQILRDMLNRYEGKSESASTPITSPLRYSADSNSYLKHRKKKRPEKSQIPFLALNVLLSLSALLIGYSFFKRPAENIPTKAYQVVEAPRPELTNLTPAPPLRPPPIMPKIDPKRKVASQLRIKSPAKAKPKVKSKSTKHR
jgi:serine/threonine protein kinase